MNKDYLDKNKNNSLSEELSFTLLHIFVKYNLLILIL